MEVPGSSQLKWLPKAARGGAGPGEPGSSMRFVREARGRKHARGGGRGEGGTGEILPSVARSARECPGCYGDGTCAAREVSGRCRGNFMLSRPLFRKDVGLHCGRVVRHDVRTARKTHEHA